MIRLPIKLKSRVFPNMACSAVDAMIQTWAVPCPPLQLIEDLDAMYEIGIVAEETAIDESAQTVAIDRALDSETVQLAVYSAGFVDRVLLYYLETGVVDRALLYYLETGVDPRHT